MSDLEGRMKRLDARLSARASELDARIGARFGKTETNGGLRSNASASGIGLRAMGGSKGSAVKLSLPGDGGVRYGLFVGMNTVDHAKWKRLGWEMSDLTGAVPDARNMAAVCRDLGGWLPENETVLENATVAGVRSELLRLAGLAKGGDVVLVFYSGHGGPTRLDDPANDTQLCLLDGPYQEAMLRGDLEMFRPDVRVVVVIDACHSGGLFSQSERTKAPRMASSRAFFMPPKGALSANVGWITAAGADETSLDAQVSGTGGKFTTFTLINNGWRAGLADGVADWCERMQEDGEAEPPRKSGMVSFFDLVRYAQCELGQYLTRDDSLVPVQQVGSLVVAVPTTSYNAHVPQYSNPDLLASVVAGRTGDRNADSTDPNQPKERDMNKNPKNFTDAVDLDSAMRTRGASAPRNSAEHAPASDSVRRAASSNSALSRILKAALGRGAAPKGTVREYKEYVDCSFGTIQG